MLNQNNYKNIAKTSGLIGLVQIIRIVFGIINTKVLAVFIGTAGYGIYGMYQSFISITSSFASLGVNQSGVREISKKASDSRQVLRCIWIFRHIVFISSILVAVVCIAFSKTISKSLFGTSDYCLGVSIVALTIITDAVSRGQIAILNGLRYIRYMALSQIIGIILGSIATVGIVIIFRDKGIVIYILAISVFSFLTTSWFVCKLRLKLIKPTYKEFIQGTKSLLKIGLGFCITGLIFGGMTYISRLFLLHNFGLESVGIYMASWTLSNLYVGMVLSSMGVDFMPRIMKNINKNSALNIDINEQMEFGVAVTGIGVVSVIIFASVILNLFYSSEFVMAQTIIRWQALGVALRVLAYPMGYVVMGKDKPITYTLLQTGFYVLEFMFLVIVSKLWGFNALGVNYFVGYLIYCIVLFVIMKRMINLKMSLLLKKLLAIEWLFIIISFVLSVFLTGYYLWFIGGLLFIIMVFYTNSVLKRCMNIDIKTIFMSKYIKRE